MRRIALLALLVSASALTATSAYAAPAPSPTVTLQPAWTIPSPGPMAGGTVWARTPGIFTSPESNLAYSALGQRTFTGRYTCDELGPGPTSVVQAIDSRSGAVVSTFTPDLPARAPITDFAMDQSAQRIVVFSGTCPSYVWTTMNAKTGATLARWEVPFTQLPAHVAMGNDPNWIYLLDSLPANRPDYREFRVQAMNTLSGQIRWTSSIGTRPWADFFGDLPTRQYRAQSLAVSADGSQIYAIPNTGSEVLLIDASTGQVTGRVALPESRDIRSIAVSPVSPRLFVSDWTNNVIRIVNTDTLNVSGAFPAPGRCLESMDIDATGDVLAVLAACDNPRIILMRTSDGSVLSEGAAAGDTSEIRMLPNGTGLIARRSAELTGTSITESLPPSRPAKKAPPIPAPTQPRSVSVATSTTSARVTWAPPANATKSKVTGYRVTSRPGDRTCVVKAGARSCTFSGLQSGRRYAFTIEARNISGYGLRSQSPVVTLPVPAPPAPDPTPTPPPPKPAQPIT